MQLTDEMKDLLEELVPPEELEQMSVEEKIQWCVDWREAEDIANDDYFSNNE